MKIAVRMIFECLILLLVVVVTQGVADTACSDPLGMESGKIKDSQITVSGMYGTAGGESARLNEDIGRWGVWFLNQIRGTDEPQHVESITIDLLNVTKITKVATEGRTGPQRIETEYTREYKIFHSNDNSNWKLYEHKGSQVFKGNDDTRTVVSHELNPPIYARYIRIHPGYYKHNLKCLRLELYGRQQSGPVPARPGIVSYSMPQGRSTKNNRIHYKDTSYSGTEGSGMLDGGVGLLTDGKFGPVNSKEHMGGGWVGWNASVAEPHGVNITFEFNTLRKFNNVTVTMNINSTRKNMPFKKSRIFFATTKDELSEAGYLEYMYCPKLEKGFYNLNITLPLRENVGKFVRLQFYLGGRWVLFSEITFNSVPAKEYVMKLKKCNDLTGVDKNVPTTLNPTTESPCTGANIIIGLICLCIILAVVILALLLHLRRKSKQLRSKQNVLLELNSRDRDIERDLTARTNEIVVTNLPETERNEDSYEDPSPYVIPDPSYMYTSLTARDDVTTNRYQRLLKDSNDQSSKSLTQTQQTGQNGDCEIVSPNVISDPSYTQLTSHRDDDIVNPYQELLKSSSNPSQST